ncbi:PEP-CTERM sorting domain-containing protein [Kiritimatiellota bacterium B12222]|nr:PEP-CTERM sorting domain-containing protein [Kiritimatiellota bacterium B12222]
MTFFSLKLTVTTLIFLLYSSLLCGEIVLVSHDFSGLSSAELNGQTATVFNPGITAAGGSATWVASTDFKADGSVTGTDSDAARLFLGDYITDHLGTATGKFTLTATLNPASGGDATDFLSLGYFTGAIALSDDFASDDQNYAVGTALTRRINDSSDFFVGRGADNSINAITGTGLRTFSIEFDFTPEGGYNGTTNFGTVTFDSDNLVGSLPFYSYNSAVDIQYIGITRDDNVQGNFSALSLTQIPEPSSLLLIFIAGMGLFMVRRR